MEYQYLLQDRMNIILWCCCPTRTSAPSAYEDTVSFEQMYDELGTWWRLCMVMFSQLPLLAASFLNQNIIIMTLFEITVKLIWDCWRSSSSTLWRQTNEATKASERIYWVQCRERRGDEDGCW